MAKVIDPVDIKVAIESGQLEVVVKRDKDFYGRTNLYYIYIKDRDNGDTVLIKTFA